jgi:hypothetical protein
LIKAGCETICSQVHELVWSIRNNDELPQQRKESIVVPVSLINCLQNFI